MRPGVRRAGIVGGVVGLAAAGAAAGLAAERYAVGRVRFAPDPYADEPFGRLPADRTRTVRTDDGVPLHVEEVGPADAPLTVVLVHGYCLDMGTFHFQRKELAGFEGPPLRQVLYDQRGHGRSGRGPREHATIDQLGADLGRVVDEVVPRGPIVLIGHSMGGMTVMALADRRPELFHSRVLGVALLSTSSGRLGDVTFGLPSAFAVVRRPVMPLLVRGMQHTPALFERGRRIGSDIAFLLTRRYGFGDKHVSPALVEYVERMIASTPVEVIAEFMTAFSTHDKLAALAEMTEVETLVLAGTDDLMTPVAHSRTIAEQLPQAELVEVEDGGHLVLLERAPLVNLHLRAFLHRAARGVASPAPRRFRKA